MLPIKCNHEYALFIDINECDSGVCPQSCLDNDGSYTCGCYSGYQLQDDKTSCSRKMQEMFVAPLSLHI